MTPIVEHRDWQGKTTHLVEVRDDLALSFVACVKCKGTGNEWHCVGGDLIHFGWSIHRNFGCAHCGAKGYWQAGMREAVFERMGLPRQAHS